MFPKYENQDNKKEKYSEETSWNGDGFCSRVPRRYLACRRPQGWQSRRADEDSFFSRGMGVEEFCGGVRSVPTSDFFRIMKWHLKN